MPAGLMLSPDGCFPTVIVPMALGGLACEVDDADFVVGHLLRASPSLITLMESATSAIEPEGSMARLTGGPTTEFFSGRLATIFGFIGSARSTISTESRPGGDSDGLNSIVPQTLLVIADDHEWRGLRKP